MSQSHLTTSQVAEEYHLSESWLSKLRMYGGGPTYLKVGRRVIYQREDVEKWLAKCRKKHTLQIDPLFTASYGMVARENAAAYEWELWRKYFSAADLDSKKEMYGDALNILSWAVAVLDQQMAYELEQCAKNA